MFTVLLVRPQMEIRDMLLDACYKVVENLAELYCVGWKEEFISDKLTYLTKEIFS